MGDVVGNKLQRCEGRLTWESGEKRIDYMLFGKGLDVIKMVTEDSGNLDVKSVKILSGAKWCGGGQRLK